MNGIISAQQAAAAIIYFFSFSVDNILQGFDFRIYVNQSPPNVAGAVIKQLASCVNCAVVHPIGDRLD
jgi:hypothetical protein